MSEGNSSAVHGICVTRVSSAPTEQVSGLDQSINKFPVCLPPPLTPVGQATGSLWCFPKERPAVNTHSPQLAQSLPGGWNVTKTGKPFPLLARVCWDTHPFCLSSDC